MDGLIVVPFLPFSFVSKWQVHVENTERLHAALKVAHISV